MHSFLHFDTKAWRTLPMLVVRPGTLTRDYIHGKRARYISPLATFLFTLFVMFFVFSFGAQPLGEVETEAEFGGAFVVDGVVGERAEEEGPQTLQEEINAALDSGGIDFYFPDKKLNEKIERKLRNIDLLLYKVQQTIYKFAFLLVPIALPFLALMFIGKRGVTLFDHVVFSLYSLSFMSMLAIALALLGHLGSAVPFLTAPMGAIITSLVLLGPTVQIFFHLKGSYALGWTSAAWRSILLAIFAGISLAIFFVIVFLAGMLG
jgi:hypothetical protein